MFLFVLSAATCLCFFFLFFFSIYTSLLVSHTSSRSRGTTTTTKKKYHDVKNAIVDIFVYLVLIYSCSFISLFEFLIYYNLAIYMNKAVRSVECYLLPSCVFVKMGQRLKKKKRTFFFFFLSLFVFGLNLTELCETSTSRELSLPRRGRGNLWELLGKKNDLPVI